MKVVTPENWNLVSIFDVAPITSRLVDPKDEAYNKMTLIAPNHIQSKSGQIICYETAEEQNAISGKYLVKKCDVIYSKIRPYLMKSTVAAEDCLCSADMYPLSPTSEILPVFLNTVLLGEHFTYYANSCSARTGIPKLNREDMSAFKILLPPLPEQKAIADLLSTWDSAIEKTERLIAAKEKRFQWLLDELINQNLNKHNWKNSSFAEIFEPSKNKYDASGELPVLSVTKDGIVLQSEYFNKEIASDDLNGYLIVDYNDFVMSGLNFWMGSVDFQTIVEQGIVSPAYKVYKVKTNSVTIDYLKFFVRSTSMTKLLITSSVMGASIVRRNLDKEMLGNSVIKIPSPMEQEKIVSSLNLSNRELVALRNILSKYKEQKRGLMQKLLTGEWRVKEA